MLRRLVEEERGLILGFFVRLVLVFALVILALAEGGQILFAHVRAHNAAVAAAEAGADAFGETRSVQRAREAAVTAAHEESAQVSVVRLEVIGGGTVRVTTRSEASTMLVRRIGFLRDLGIRRATDEASA